MDAATKPVIGEEALPAAADAQQLEAVEPEPSSSSPERGDAAAAVAGAEGEDDDEQVERFYALLDNIRALRGMLGGAAAGRKRGREAEPPWRPAFRMEDFEAEEVDSDSVACGGAAQKKRKQIDEREGGRCGASRATGDEEDGDVVVESGDQIKAPARRVAREC